MPMMKPETRAAMLKQPLAIKQEIIALLADDLDASDFCDALMDKDGLTDDGEEIRDELADDDEREAWLDEVKGDLADQFTPIHEAICEGRKQDAIDMPVAIIPTSVNYWRSVAEQNRLFPDRVQFDF